MFDFFSFAVNYYKDKTLITMKLFTSIINTCDLPYTIPILEVFLPSILNSVCYNDAKLPFKEEVKETEIGHLFEHMLLEYLCITKLSRGFRDVEFSGYTDWNWRKHPQGTFHITINSGIQTIDIMPIALLESSNLLRLIFESSMVQPLHTNSLNTVPTAPNLLLQDPS